MPSRRRRSPPPAPSSSPAPLSRPSRPRGRPRPHPMRIAIGVAEAERAVERARDLVLLADLEIGPRRALRLAPGHELGDDRPAQAEPPQVRLHDDVVEADIAALGDGKAPGDGLVVEVEG